MNNRKIKVAFASDDTNEAVESAIKYLQDNCDLTIEFASDRWPIMSKNVAKLVASREVDFGVLMCWTGTGTAIAANKVKGIRAATVMDAYTAKNARLWNDANIIALSLKRLSPEVVVECLEAFLSITSPDATELDNIALIEE